MKRAILFVMTIVLSSLLLSNCASRKEIVQFQEDVQYLKIRVDTLNQQNQQLKRMIRNLNGSISAMEQEFVRTRADLLAEMTSIREQSMTIDNKLEDNISQISRYVAPSERYAPVQPPAASDTVAQTTDISEKDSLQQQSAETPVIDAQQLYNAAYLDVTRGNYGLARQEFTEFLRLFPVSSLADNAQYWMGESYYAEGNFREAITSFERVLDNYPGGDKGSAAMLKLGFSYQKLGDNSRARAYLERVSEKYPGTDEARIARERLEEME